MLDDLYKKIVGDVPHQLQRGLVWCTHCGRGPVKVDAAEAIRNGWPKCCGYTMTIDSPEERAILRARKESR